MDVVSDGESGDELRRLARRRGPLAVGRALDERSDRAVIGYSEDDPAYHYRYPSS
jgi:hypothetical protein